MLYQIQKGSLIFKIRKKHENIKSAAFNPQVSLLRYHWSISSRMSRVEDLMRWKNQTFCFLNHTHCFFCLFVLKYLLLNLIRVCFLDIGFLSFFLRLKIAWYPVVSHCAYWCFMQWSLGCFFLFFFLLTLLLILQTLLFTCACVENSVSVMRRPCFHGAICRLWTRASNSPHKQISVSSGKAPCPAHFAIACGFPDVL